ncbi:MAG: N-acetyltransferase [Clostridiales bacterium]|nr:N-acetyltransferase [Clostridiales bacterium]
MEFQVTDGRVFSADEKQELMAEATYTRLENGEVNIDRTYVNPVLRGQGAAGKLMEAVAGHLREQGLKATATCSYANAWFHKNREAYADIISNDLSD